jgi:hypothetical protein
VPSGRASTSPKPLLCQLICVIPIQPVECSPRVQADDRLPAALAKRRRRLSSATSAAALASQSRCAGADVGGSDHDVNDGRR